ncbi:molybdopterin-dependent oxidoreductase [Saccharospirillum salsuginis]|uniref:Oxidoreductase molybdopterin-binding domain-containing protein n=1 Tax=Saccharospirillum salsuginis TaxID=418750 RepID=A0A918KB29_9GAMM|nr:molybdopterin-dependent oxidoreductase [Saccharospirillum salsuginis]GGX56735.1 hypothetical protein GCM10007392_25240 [Saccharospirillum salsuginis]
MMRPLYTLAVLLLLICPVARALAETLEVAGPNGTHTYTQTSLLELGRDRLETETPWTDGPQSFGGVPLERVLAVAGIESGRVAAEALNGYSVDIPVQAVVEAGAFLASHLDGEPMRVKDKGPYWIVFPWSSNADLDNRDVHAWSIWQLQRLQSLE